MHGGVCAAAASALVGLAAAGCGQVDVDGSDGGPGSAIDATGIADALGADSGGSSDSGPPSGARCTSDMSFARVEPALGLNGRNFQCCAVLADPLTAYFSAGDGQLAETADLYRATRPSPDAAFGERELLIGADTAESFWSPTLSADGQVLYYNRAPAGDVNSVRVHRSARDSEDRFGPGEVVELGGGGVREADPSLGERGLFFIRGDSLHIARPAGDGFAVGQLASELDSGGGDRDLLPAVSADGKTVYWGTSRLPTSGDVDIWVAELESEDSYGTPRPILGVNGGDFEAPSWISPDQCQLFFTTTRNNINEIWVATREPE